MAFYAGRTILRESNSLLKDVTSMIPESACVMHAIFAVTATYILDYEPSEDLEKLANEHHREAVRLLGLELNAPESYSPGKKNAVVAAIVLLNQDDVNISLGSENISLQDIAITFTGHKLGIPGSEKNPEMVLRPTSGQDYP